MVATGYRQFRVLFFTSFSSHWKVLLERRGVTVEEERRAEAEVEDLLIWNSSRSMSIRMSFIPL